MNFIQSQLYHRLLKDLRSVGIKQQFTLDIRGYCQDYFGKYDPNTNKVILYPFEDRGCKIMYSYEELLLTTLHEAIHCMQWQDPKFVRYKNVMHDSQFYSLYNHYEDKIKSLLLLKEIENDNSRNIKTVWKSFTPVYS